MPRKGSLRTLSGSSERGSGIAFRTVLMDRSKNARLHACDQTPFAIRDVDLALQRHTFYSDHLKYTLRLHRQKDFLVQNALFMIGAVHTQVIRVERIHGDVPESPVTRGVLSRGIDRRIIW